MYYIFVYNNAHCCSNLPWLDDLDPTKLDRDLDT